MYNILLCPLCFKHYETKSGCDHATLDVINYINDEYGDGMWWQYDNRTPKVRIHYV